MFFSNFILGSVEKEEPTQKLSRVGIRHKALPNQPPPQDAEVPQLPQSPTTLPLPPMAIQPSSTKRVLPSTHHPLVAGKILPSSPQSPSQLIHPTSPQPIHMSSQPLDPSSSQSSTSVLPACESSQSYASQPPQPSYSSLPAEPQVEDDTTKKTKVCDEQQKLNACESVQLDRTQTAVPQTVQTPIPQTVMDVTVTAAQPSFPSVGEKQSSAPRSPPSQLSSLPAPPVETTAVEASVGIITATGVQSSSSLLLPPPTTTTTTIDPPSASSPHSKITKLQTSVIDKVSQSKEKSTLVLPSTKKTALLATGGGAAAGAQKGGKLKRESSHHRRMNTRGKQLQQMNNVMDKENKRKSGTVESKLTQPLPSQMETERQPPQRAPFLNKRNPSPRLILKPSNISAKEAVNKPKYVNKALAVKDISMKAMPQVETVGTTVKSIPEAQSHEAVSADDKCILKKSPQPHRHLSRTLSGSKLPRNPSAPESMKPPKKKLSNLSKKLPSPVKRSAAETVSRLKLPSMSGRTIPVTHSSKNSSTAPQIKATLPVRNGNTLRQKPSLLKTPKPVL